MRTKNKNNLSETGNAILIVVIFLMVAMVGGVAFLKKTGLSLGITGFHTDAVDARYQMEAAYEIEQAKLNRGIDNIVFDGRLALLTNNSSIESFDGISDTYTTNKTAALQFLKDIVKSEAMSLGGSLNESHEFADFDSAFPTTWTDPDPTDNQYYEIKYSFYPLIPTVQSNPNEITFEYEYQLSVRAYGQHKFSTSTAEDAGVISVLITGAPFSTWAVFRDRTQNQNGSNLNFIGGNTSAQLKDVFNGKVHTNQRPYFYGHPVFNSKFTSAAAENTWVQSSSSSYSCCATFNEGKQGSVESISLPTVIFNTARLAAGDPSNNAGTNNTAMTGTELVGYLTEYAGGTIPDGTTNLADGIYVPITNQASKYAKGGVYVKGDARVTMDVVQGSGDFSGSQWSKIQGGHQSCKFQKVSIDSLASGANTYTRDIYIGDDPCEVTYVFNAEDAASDPVLVDGRINGNVHVEGAIDRLGGASRTRPSVATDFSMTISAVKDVRIHNDLQYEDAEYVAINSDGSQGSETVADPKGITGDPTQAELAAVMDDHSLTVLGIVSTQRNVVVHTDAPSHINLHGAIFAGNSAAYNAGTGLGCGSTNPGCGFGYEGWNTVTGKGTLKLFGSVSEYRNQTLGVSYSNPTGYSKRYTYDSRMTSSITPPGFPISTQVFAQTEVKPFKIWRISRAED